VSGCKSLNFVEQDIWHTKMVLELRPAFHRLEDLVRCHAFLCLLAQYVRWHTMRVLEPLLAEEKEHSFELLWSTPGDDPAQHDGGRGPAVQPHHPARRTAPPDPCTLGPAPAVATGLKSRLVENPSGPMHSVNNVLGTSAQLIPLGVLCQQFQCVRRTFGGPSSLPEQVGRPWRGQPGHPSGRYPARGIEALAGGRNVPSSAQRRDPAIARAATSWRPQTREHHQPPDDPRSRPASASRSSHRVTNQPARRPRGTTHRPARTARRAGPPSTYMERPTPMPQK